MVQPARRGRSWLLIAPTGAARPWPGSCRAVELAEPPNAGRHPHPLRLPAQGPGGGRGAKPHAPVAEMGLPVRWKPAPATHRRTARHGSGEAAGRPADHARESACAEPRRARADVRGAEDDRGRQDARLRKPQARRPAVAALARLQKLAPGVRASASRPRSASPTPIAVARARRRQARVDLVRAIPAPAGLSIPLGGARSRGPATPGSTPSPRLAVIEQHRTTLVFVQHPLAGRVHFPGAVGAERRGAADRHPPRRLCRPRRGASQAAMSPASCAQWSPPPASTSASTGARSTSSSSWPRPRAPRACCNASAAPTTGWMSQARASSSPATGSNILRLALRSTRSKTANSTPRSFAPARLTCSRSISSPWP